MSNGTRFAVVAAGVLVAALVGFNVLAQSVGDAPSPSPSPSWVTFTSDRHGYSIAHPADWRVIQQPGDANLRGMQIGSAGTDLIAPPEYVRSGSEDGLLVVSVHELLDGESLDQFADRVAREAACGDSFGFDQSELGGEPAAVRGRECDYWEWLEVVAIHGGRGYVIWEVSTLGPAPKERPINQEFLASFRFND